MSVEKLDSRGEPAGPNSLTPNQQLAHFALQLVSNSRAATDDNTQAGIAAVKTWLRDIANAKLVVGKPMQDAPAVKKGRKL